ncbi:hypothetical protein [Ruegeria atlantica]|uniref:hypothetical protein n=1 Tax=Ruegeria atlantica TaxID=81569 RepID=UPI00147BE366|nr:hypothetical protein [Ruegeria atlantica]
MDKTGKLVPEDQLETLLNTLDSQTCQIIAVRAVLRSIPAAMSVASHNSGRGVTGTRLLLSCMRTALTASVISQSSSADVKKLRTAAKTAANDCSEAAEEYSAPYPEARASARTALSASSALTTSLSYSRNAGFQAANTAMTAAGKLADDETTANDTRLAFYAEYTNDAATPVSSAFQTPLWRPENYPAHLSDQWERFEAEAGQDSSWLFWVDWYRGLLNGQPLDWELQRRVALIRESAWQAGPDTVAAEIKQIQARWKVETALAELKNSFREQHFVRHGIGENNPNESIEDERSSGSITLIWEAAEELSEELEKENPKRERVERIFEQLKAAYSAFTDWTVTKWIGRKADLAVDTAIETAIKQGGLWVGGYYALDKLIKAVEEWLPFLS